MHFTHRHSSTAYNELLFCMRNFSFSSSYSSFARAIKKLRQNKAHKRVSERMKIISWMTRIYVRFLQRSAFKKKKRGREKGRSRMTERKAKCDEETVKAENLKSHFIIALNNHVYGSKRVVKSVRGAEKLITLFISHIVGGCHQKKQKKCIIISLLINRRHL